ncbi:MAG: phosphoglucomutase/phosphomannomutase family protein [Saprospiraceae bacterium]|nr:phosphoglucomutase/phosphomannomutase family protein [Saprospiraceae bacterium]
MKVSYQIKFGTDGWRAIIGDGYTLENVRRVAAGTAFWMRSQNLNSVVVGHDCRFGGKMFMEEVVKVFIQEGLNVFAAKDFVSTPMVSLAVLNLKADLGIVITASHNPPEYNGYKLKSSYGGPTPPEDIESLESMIPFEYNLTENRLDQQLSGFEWVNLEEMYLEKVRSSFDIEKISKYNQIAYDAMYGAGQNVMKKLFPKMTSFHCEWNPGFNHTAPEPIAKNLVEIVSYLSNHKGQYIGIAHDGDADRIAMIDSDGQIIDSHHLLLLLIRYLHEVKKYSGDVVISFSVTNKVKKLAEHYGLKTTITKVGFKYIASNMMAGDVLVAGEESGGLAVKGHIPERDGVWIAMTIMEYIAHTGKDIRQLIQEIYGLVGSFVYDRKDLKLWPEQMESVKKQLESGIVQNWGSFKTTNYENLDGHKYYFEHDNWLMFRMSGTEPVLRIYSQGRDKEECQAILEEAQRKLGLTG